MSEILYGNEFFMKENERRTQVYYATHVVPTSPTASWNRKSYMERSFISFSFGGRWIEDWNLIATIEGDKMQVNGSAQFEDLTSQYDVIDGQFYWGTHFTNNIMNFILATDGITQEQLDDFRHWFSAGSNRELILAEHPNRAIMARISQPLIISVLPFEEPTEVNVNNVEYRTSTTLYKGQIQVSMIMDEPFWYSKIDFFDDNWKDVNNEDVNSLEDKDVLKMIKEDGIPYVQAVSDNILLSNNYIIKDKKVVKNSNGLTLMENENGYLYYPGNAPTRPIITFTFSPIIDQSTGYITSPRNIFTDSNKPYDTISFQSTTTQELKFTLPGAYVGYNQAMKIFNTVNNNVSFVELRRLIRDNVTHKHARAWAMTVVDSLYYIDKNVMTTNASNLRIAKQRMKFFLLNENQYPTTVSRSLLEGNIAMSSPNNLSSSYPEIYTTKIMIRGGILYRDEKSGLSDILYYAPRVGPHAQIIEGKRHNPSNIDRSAILYKKENKLSAEISGDRTNKQNAKVYSKFYWINKTTTERDDTWLSTTTTIDCETGKATSQVGFRVFTLAPEPDDEDYIYTARVQYEDTEDSTYHGATLFKDPFSYDDAQHDNKTYKSYDYIHSKDNAIVNSGKGIPKDTRHFFSLGTNNNLLTVEDSGDMLQSIYINLEDKNRPNKEGLIVPWTENNNSTTYKFWHDNQGGLSNIQIDYKYLYY